jgi:4-amino-4-deoxy-L-arabinose transferase-like glycosyltransferase
MDQSLPANQIKWLYFFIGVAVVVNFSGLFITLIGPDATLYATIAKTMVLRHDYINLYAGGHDWLDKPHFPFWITALSFNIFGISGWAYKLPGVLFLMMGAAYTYHFAKNLYNKQIALWAVLILLTAEHIVLSDNDVRAEPYLTGLIIASVYHFYKAYSRNNYWQLVAGCVFAACTVMTKGMFVLVPIGGAMAGQFIIHKQWKQLFSLKTLLAIILVLIFILPELYCLYQQFDLHPEKIVFGYQNVSGIKFFFWDSQFGRFFNTGPIKGGGDPLFFIHTTLWAFLPWSLLLFAAIFRFIKVGIKNVKAHEWYCICGSLLTFLMFSASKFQLPYYLNIVFPFFAIITAQYLFYVQQAASIKAIGITQIIVIVVVLLVICAIEYFFLPVYFKWYVLAILCVLYLAMVFLPDMISSSTIQKLVIGTVLLSFIVNVYLNLAFYPSLLRYQAGSEAAKWINKNNPKNYPVMQTGDDYPWPMEFYLKQHLISINPDTIWEIPRYTFMLYAPADSINKLKQKGWELGAVCELDRYWISRLIPAFLNNKTRAKQLTKMQVVIVNPHGVSKVVTMKVGGRLK